MGSQADRGESSMWGDYHLLELGVYLQRRIENKPYLSCFTPG
jgi:unsaturated chondroitin disaccharide hydrolase